MKVMKLAGLFVLVLPLFNQNLLARQSVSSRLNGAQDDLTGILDHYTDAHPAVQAKRQQIQTLKVKELQNAESELTDLLLKYTEQHPLVQQKRQQIAALKPQQKQTLKTPKPRPRKSWQQRRSSGLWPN